MKEKQHKYVVMYFSKINRQSKRLNTYFSPTRSIEKGKTKQLYEFTTTSTKKKRMMIKEMSNPDPQLMSTEQMKMGELIEPVFT